MTSRSVLAISVVAVAVACELGHSHAADQHERDGPGSADLRLVVSDLLLLLPYGPPRHPDADLRDHPADKCMSLLIHWFPFARLRMAYAIRDWRLQSSMKPGLACWEKRPPDSPNPARAGS